MLCHEEISMEIAGLAVIVTGGASGLGGATARHLAALGAKVTIFDLNEESGRAHAMQRRTVCVSSETR